MTKVKAKYHGTLTYPKVKGPQIRKMLVELVKWQSSESVVVGEAVDALGASRITYRTPPITNSDFLETAWRELFQYRMAVICREKYEIKLHFKESGTKWSLSGDEPSTRARPDRPLPPELEGLIIADAKEMLVYMWSSVLTLPQLLLAGENYALNPNLVPSQ